MNLRRIRGQIDKKSTVADRPALFEILFEEASGLHIDTHGGKDDREVVLVAIVNAFGSSGTLDKTSLSTDLCSNLVVRKTSRGKDGDFLASSDGVLPLALLDLRLTIVSMVEIPV